MNLDAEFWVKMGHIFGHHPKSVKQVIADIEAMMKDEVEESKGYEQCRRALNYWRNRPRRSKDDKTQS